MKKLGVALALVLSASLGSLGCPAPPAPDPSDDPGDDLGIAPCAGLLSLDPEEGDVVWTRSVTVTWDAVPENGAVRVEDATGTQVPGAFHAEDNGRTVVFQADEPLTSETTFAVTITQDCAPDVEYAFETVRYGDPVEDPEAVLDRVYAIDLRTARFTPNPGGGPLTQGWLLEADLLVQLVASSDLADGRLDLLGADADPEGESYAQRTCSEARLWTAGPDGVPTGEWADPSFSLTADEVPFAPADRQTAIRDLVLTGTFLPDASGWVGGTFAGWIDLRALFSSEDAAAACELRSLAEPSCQPCPDGDAFCVYAAAEEVRGHWVPDVAPLVPRTCADLIADNRCSNHDYTVDGEPNGDIDPALCPEWGGERVPSSHGPPTPHR